MRDYNLLGACGLFCGACNHYRASFPESKHLLDKALEQGRKLEGFICSGCRSGKLYIHKGCAECDIRACVEMKSIEHCGECQELPCDKLVSFQNDGHTHHLDVVSNANEIMQKGMEQWLMDQKEKWQCKCGLPFSWYEDICGKCSSKVDSYGSK